MTEHFGDWVPTVVRGGFIGDEIDRADRHIIASLGPDGAWTLCRKWIPLGRLRILSRDLGAHTMQIREKRHYRIGSGAWEWLWHAPSQLQPTAIEEVSHGGPESRLKPGVGALRLPWWRRWFRRAA